MSCFEHVLPGIPVLLVVLFMSVSRPSTVAVLGAFHVAELALKNKGLLSTSPSPVGSMENPTFFFL